MTDTTTTQPLAFAWDWSRAEHLRMHRRLLGAVMRRGTWRTIRIGALGFSAVLALVAIVPAIGGNLDPFRAVFPLLAFVAFWWALLLWISPRSSVRAFEKFHSGPQRLTLSGQGVESGCDVCSNRVAWEKIVRAVETPEFLFLFYSSGCAFYLPARVVKTPGERAHVRDALQAYLPANVKVEGVA